MSEYQYYEFQAIDRTLSEQDRREMRTISTRAEITSTSFTNHYEWGDFNGDPDEFLERWFDLHVYVTNWGTRRFMIRLPKRLFDAQQLDRFLSEADPVRYWTSGDHLILDTRFEEVGIEDEIVEDYGDDAIARLAPLRSNLIAGDLRLLYLLWLTATEDGAFEDDHPEPMPGIGPLTDSLQAFVDFVRIDPDLVAAAAERPATTIPAAVPAEAARQAIAALPDSEKTDLLTRFVTGDRRLTPEIQGEIRRRLAVDNHAQVPAPHSGRASAARERGPASAQARGRRARDRTPDAGTTDGGAGSSRTAERDQKAGRSRLVRCRKGNRTSQRCGLRRGSKPADRSPDDR